MTEPEGQPSHAAVDFRAPRRGLASRRVAWIGLAVSLSLLAAVPALIPDQPATTENVGTRAAALSTEAVPRSAPGRSTELPTVKVRSAALSQEGSVSRPPSTPVQLTIPSLGVEAIVQPTGVRPDGTVDIPDDAFRVGWYRYGAAPGDRHGSVVLVGHVDSRLQGRGALYVLRGSNVGDKISLTLADGKRLGYRVVARQMITKTQLPTEELFARNGRARLTIVTCGGPYLKDRGGYQDNLVVTAVPMPS